MMEGGLRTGDQLLAVNGKILLGVSHNRCVEMLKAAGPNIVLLAERSSSLAPRAASSSLANSEQAASNGGDAAGGEEDSLLYVQLHKGHMGLGFYIVAMCSHRNQPRNSHGYPSLWSTGYPWTSHSRPTQRRVNTVRLRTKRRLLTLSRRTRVISSPKLYVTPCQQQRPSFRQPRQYLQQPENSPQCSK